MNKLKLLSLSSLLVAGLAQAGNSCEGFEIKVKNNLSDDLIARKISLQGANIQPGGIEKLNSKSEETFTVNAVQNENGKIKGTLIFDTISLPVKEVKINFSLENKGLICEHVDNTKEGSLSADKIRMPGKVLYTINY
ncbi:MAG: hypothetical protein LCH30_11630 [Proteobacteria bacterium]|nr:hypothetical protein [Pseudomonadota bacterium]